MNTTGPSRLILIRAGKYDYAEIDLTRPLHLIGPNNVGKTSLVATLQFLYVDDKNHMRFSRTLEESLRHYFPDHNSYVLFEILTTTGFMVVGMQGQGPLRQFDFQRFTYLGRYDRADYIDEDKLRDPDEVRARFASRGYTPLEPKHLRTALTGVMDGNEISFGLIPTRHRNDYVRFRDLFCNLLRLSHLRQDELKKLFCGIYRDQLHQVEVELQTSGYADRYKVVMDSRNELQHLKAIEHDTQRLLGLAKKRNELRHLLPDLWFALRTESEREDMGLGKEIEDADQKAAGFKAEYDAWEKRRLDIDRARRASAEKRGGLMEKIRQHDELETEFASYLVDFEQVRLRELETRLEELGGRLHGVTADSPERLRREVEGLSGQIAYKHALLSSIEHNVAGEVRDALSETEASKVFRLLNPSLLGLAVRDDAVRVKNRKKAKDALKGLVKRLVDDIYEDEAVVIPLGALADPRVGDYSDPTRLQSEITELEGALRRARNALNDAEQVGVLRAERDNLRSEKDIQAAKIACYRSYQDNKPKAAIWRADLKDIDLQIADLDGQYRDAEKRMEALNEDVSKTRAMVNGLVERRNRLQARARQLQKPPDEWPMTGTPIYTDSLDDLIERYQTAVKEESALSRQLSEGLSAVHIQGYQYEAGGEDERLAILSEHLDALSEREKAVDELWRSLVTDLGYAFKALVRDVETLKMRVDDLNRHLDSVNVSNLERLQLSFVERAELTTPIRKVVEAGDLSLFSDRSETNQAREQIKEMLQRHSSIPLFDLFDLGFKVTTPGGKVQSYPHLDRIESNGTSITIKVLIHMILIRGLLNDRRDVTIPFYLDEAASLDQENLSGIVTQALSLGFVPILASPEPMEVADNLYFLREQNGRISMRPQSQVRLRPELELQN